MFLKKKKGNNEVFADRWNNFVIPEIGGIKKEVKKESSQFVSPFHGTNVKDDYQGQINDIDMSKRFDIFREQSQVENADEVVVLSGEQPEYKEVMEEVTTTRDLIEEDMIELTGQPDVIETAPEEDVAVEQMPYFDIEEIVEEELTSTPVYSDYTKPPMTLLNVTETVIDTNNEWVESKINLLNNTLQQFKIDGKVSKHTVGPAVTRFEVELNEGVQVNKIRNISDDLKMRMAVTDLRMEIPIPGKNAVGVEIPNVKVSAVNFGSLVNNDEFQNSSPLTVALGKDIDGNNIYLDIQKMPHGLIAGSTGSGKSVCINTIISSLIMKNSPSDLRLMLIDPKVVELASYNDLPHLVTPVITDPKQACKGLKWAVEEMDRRYNVFSKSYCKNLESYNAKRANNSMMENMPYIVCIVDELADLMMVAGSEVEEAIMRITQKARAAGIHLLVATQRPSADVIKGTIKTNIPSRIAFSVSSYVDSNTILGCGGAERLLGRGDMLISENGKPLKRVQGAYLGDNEIESICDFIRSQGDPIFMFDKAKLETSSTAGIGGGDDLFKDVAYFVVRQKSASMSRIQREFNIGFPRANSLIELLEGAGVVGPNLGPRAREVLLTEEQLNSMFQN